MIKKEDITSKKTDRKTPQSIGIEDIKLMREKLFLKPIHGSTKAVIIADAQLLTTPAQNALLKILEEPPPHTIIMLLTENADALLPTIISRCKVVQLEDEQEELSQKETEIAQQLILAFDKLTVASALESAEQLSKNKEEATRILEHVILNKRDEMIKQAQADNDDAKNSARSITSLHLLLIDLKTTNVNPRLAIEATLLSLR